MERRVEKASMEVTISTQALLLFWNIPFIPFQDEYFSCMQQKK